MAAASGERAPAFTAQELEKLVDGVLPQYTLLYGPPDQQRPPEEGHLACHRQGGPDPGGPPETGNPLLEKMGGHLPLQQEDGGGSAGDGARRTMTPLMFRILAVAYPELDGRLRASQQTQGGLWSAPATRAGSVTRSQGTGSPPPVKALKLESGRRDRVKTPGGKTTHMGAKGIGESAVTPPKVGKGQRKSAQPVVCVTAEKGAIIPGSRDTTASTVVTGQETPTTAGVTAQEGPSIVTGQETTAGVTAQEGPSIVPGQETTDGVTAQEGPSIVTGQETTAGVTAQEGPSIVTGAAKMRIIYEGNPHNFEEPKGIATFLRHT
ncbi:hypothetical protein NDU88_003108 [Pleurodeles waltl]|uniref:Uncharacterized protein n=1 Tax=Pleurodeles waltl TaxID=8319 RepID=A0AAV7PC20_PLEWA|nr:hypothetical protein NDU88_003108 [Pleurodeles waltl]